MVRLFLFSLIIVLFWNDLLSQNRKYYDKAKTEKIQALNYSKSLLNDLKESNENQLDKLLIAKEQLRKQREIVNIINREIQLINNEILLNENKIETLNHDMELLKKEYAELLHFAYLNIGIQNRMIYIMSATDFNQAYKRIIYLKHLTDYRKSRYLKMENSLLLIDSSVVELKKLSNEKTDLFKEKSSQVDSLEKIRNDLNNLIASTSSEIHSISAQVKSDESKKLTINQNITREIEINKKNKEEKISTKSYKLDDNISQKFVNSKKWHIWPLQKFVVIHHFGDYYHAELKDIVVKNDGIELGASAGSYVHSIFEGKVVNIISIPGSGLSVIIKHGNFYTVYSNVENVKVTKGEVVQKGQVIAKLGNNKINKMNFQLWVDKENTNPEKLNPELWLKKQ